MSSRKIANAVIVATQDDAHAIAVQERVNVIWGDRATARIIDLATYPIASSIDWIFDTFEDNVLIHVSPPLASSIGRMVGDLLRQRTSIINETFDILSISGVWWRRPRQVKIDPEVQVPEFRTFVNVLQPR